MRLIVALKQVPDTSAALRVLPGALEPHAPGVPPVVNPFDEFALEAALRLRERGRDGEVVLLTLAAGPVEESVFHGLAMGADRAIVLRLPRGASPDALATGELLAAAAAELSFDAIFCGERAVDDDAAQVGPTLAERLGLPFIGGAEEVLAREAWAGGARAGEMGSGEARAEGARAEEVLAREARAEGARAGEAGPGEARAEGARAEGQGRLLHARCRRGESAAILRAELPCVVSFVRGPELPRYASLDGIFSAGGKPVEYRDVPFDAAANRTLRVALAPAFEERAGETVPGAPAEVAVDWLVERIASRALIA